MYLNNRIIAVITARSGSKGIKDKNILSVNNIPLVIRSIQHAQSSKYIDKVFVSTDSQEYLNLCNTVLFNAKKMKLRPEHLATDEATHDELITYLANEFREYDYMVLLQPTIPYRDAKDIDACIERTVDNNANSLISICEISAPVHHTLVLEGDRVGKYLFKDESISLRQENKTGYRPNGSVYISKIPFVIENKKLREELPMVYIMKEDIKNLDIDEPNDLTKANSLLAGHNLKNKVSFKIGDRTIGRNSPCFIIAEIGVNHNGDVNIAKKMVDKAIEIGVDAVKFQTFISEKLVTKTAEKVEYQNEGEKSDSQMEMLKKLELSQDEFRELKKYCDEKGAVFISTPFDFESAEFLNELGVPAFKVGSGDMNNIPLMEQIASYKTPMIISTGMASMKEVMDTVNTVKQFHNEITLLHCTSNYPTLPENVNLNSMKTLDESFPYFVGFSDHSVGPDAAMASVACGAKVIEKHFTLDNSMDGPDHKASSNPEVFKGMIDKIRKMEKIIGSADKHLTKSEEEVERIARKSVIALRDLKQGEVITLDMITIKRPATGIKPKYMKNIIGMKMSQDIKEDEVLNYEDVE